MLRNYSVRTDLALEEKERFESDNVEIPGVILKEEYDEDREIRLTRVEIETENGAKAMGKPAGTYLTLETPDLALPDDDTAYGDRVPAVPAYPGAHRQKYS